MTMKPAVWKPVLGVLFAGVLSVLGVVMPAAPASATSCVGWPDDVALQAARGRLPAGSGTGSVPFTDSFDYAVIGTVSSVDERGLVRRHVTVDVDVEAALYLRSVPATVRLSMSDTGAMLGYPFEPGRRYFIPVAARAHPGLPDPDLRDYVMLCYPVTEVSAADSAELIAAAEQASVRVARPGEGRRPPVTVAPDAAAPVTVARDAGPADAGEDPGPWSAIGAWSVIAAGAAMAIRLVVARTLR